MPLRKDNRSERTKRLLVDTMFSLLESHTFENISVNDICVAASLSRATFYVHFEDKYELVLRCLEQFMEEIERHSGEDYTELIRTLVTAVEVKKRAFHKLFTSRENRELSTMLLNFFSDHITTELSRQQANGTSFPAPVPVIGMFYAYGMSGVITKWVIGELEFGKEELIKIILDLSRANPFSAFR